jgi:hypothetical protein
MTPSHLNREWSEKQKGDHMNDQLATVERRVDDLQRGLQEFRLDVTDRLGRSFKWTILTMAVAILATWFGIVMFLTRGATLLRQLLQS